MSSDEREFSSYWAGDTAGKQCDYPGCEQDAHITIIWHNPEEKVRLCQKHKRNPMRGAELKKGAMK